MRFVLDFIYLLLGTALMPVVLYRRLTQNRYKKGWQNRFGKFSKKNPNKKSIWIHAVSVGEVNAAKTIISQLKQNLPDYDIVITTTTDTGFAQANSLYQNECDIFYFPLDFSFVIRRAYKYLNPAICLLMELEVWPNFIHTAKKLNIPVVVVNGRISQHSFSRYKKIKPLAKIMFNKLTLILAQTEEYKKRFIKIGCPAEKTFATGSLKYDTAQILDKIKGAYHLAEQLGIDDEKLLVAGGTGNDEEKIILEVFKQIKPQFDDLRLVIVPRKPERFDHVAQLITDFGFDIVRYSLIKDGTPLPADNSQAVILGDTMGDLRKFYSLATIIFVGRSLVPMGGSDMIEAAALGKCTTFGPHTFNFNQSVDALLKGNGAILVEDKNQLVKTIQKCLTDTQFTETIAHNGREVIRKNQGATKKTVEHITKLLS